MSVAWLLAVHRSYSVPKDVLWARHGAQWMARLQQIARSYGPFEICYHALVATDSAVIAVAEPCEPMNELREKIRNELDLPTESRNGGRLVHTTVCRYRGPFADPVSFVNRVSGCSLAVRSPVRTLEVSRELVYPSLKTVVLAQVPFAAA